MDCKTDENTITLRDTVTQARKGSRPTNRETRTQRARWPGLR